MESTKVCTRCREELPATHEYFARDARRKLGLFSSCRKCENARVKQYRQENLELVRSKDRQRQKANPEHTREKSRRYAAKHKEQIREYKRQYAAKNADKVRAYKRKHYELHKAEIDARTRDWQRRNADKVRERNRSWRLRNPEKSRAGCIRRRVRRRSAEGTFTAEMFVSMLKAQRNKCYYCGCKLKKCHVDHVVPLSRGGNNDPSNLVLACATCNQRKGGKLPHEWAEGGRLL